jgi:hypothetical protein
MRITRVGDRLVGERGVGKQQPMHDSWPDEAVQRLAEEAQYQATSLRRAARRMAEDADFYTSVIAYRAAEREQS